MSLESTMVECPLIAIQSIRGEPLRIFLALKGYTKLGGNRIVLPKELAEALSIDETLIRLYLAELKLEGLIIDEHTHILDYFNDDLFQKNNIQLNEYAKEFKQQEPYQLFVNSIISLEKNPPLLTEKGASLISLLKEKAIEMTETVKV